MKRVIKASLSKTHTYIVKLWHEVDPGHDTVGPVADEEIFEVDATSPDEAISLVKREWNGPIDRIEIVDVDPDETELPFE